MLPILRADLLKVKRKWFWLLVFLGPFGVIALQGVNYGVRYDWIMQNYPDRWGTLIQFVNMFVCPALLLGMAILASQIASIEHKQTSWKQLLALPVRRRDVFISKFLITAMMIGLSSILLFIGTIVLGVVLGFGWNFPMVAILENSFYPFLAGLPVLALQLWMSIAAKNQAGPLAIGIFAAVFSTYAYEAPDWLIWKWPLMFPGKDPLPFVGLGLLVGFLIVFVGVLDFKRRDIA
ncbi:ABC transporter permease [Halobacillus amylolyticus]|uniref:ABC transporter permease n=1 Tax=Halobacillus amylolyticus TaxID=2932259 RepID=A0ABY4H8J6_9BACI|nr:ABC transporter permease [Halobacillus amylolyticus]UOR11184.1 ABC transporter permease [Halobacillus amylolyticus]